MSNGATYNARVPKINLYSLNDDIFYLFTKPEIILFCVEKLINLRTEDLIDLEYQLENNTFQSNNANDTANTDEINQNLAILRSEIDKLEYFSHYLCENSELQQNQPEIVYMVEDKELQDIYDDIYRFIFDMRINSFSKYCTPLLLTRVQCLLIHLKNSCNPYFPSPSNSKRRSSVDQDDLRNETFKNSRI
ncbi:uncharacterized protein SCDLUD_001992 [Saccharomycodes ludwigii]|uniref:uncharacterized protein n=1 Tax=Saccharomycodes ludwigii TaxID=36035 RepID=UPI001E88F8AF|nr:hypothetical protein SCDLUD_001992 [Saccharomycodes ludwigii]KAH3902177.1 hypothetical protein SCDLUD_001992 [Saccharomycodes ludwigii]